MSVAPKPRQQRKIEETTRDIKILDLSCMELFKRDVNAIQSLFNQRPNYKFITKSGKDEPKSLNDIRGFLLSLNITGWIDNYDVEFNETVFQEGNNVSIREYRYALRSMYVEDDFFRFDHNCKMAQQFPAQHINADEKKYGKSHFTYPEDLVINLENVNSVNMISAFEYYVSPDGTHPVVNRGRNYAEIIN